MSNFPLYTTLSNDLPKKDLTIKQKHDLIKSIGDFDVEASERFYALITTYYVENEKDRSGMSVPYNGKLGKTIDFDLLKFPNGLRQLLYKFSTLHREKMAEDKELLKLQQGVKKQAKKSSKKVKKS